MPCSGWRTCTTAGNWRDCCGWDRGRRAARLAMSGTRQYRGLTAHEAGGISSDLLAPAGRRRGTADLADLLSPAIAQCFPVHVAVPPLLIVPIIRAPRS